MVLPDPGGPLISRWWPPAAATSSARRATSWPFTAARSSPTCAWSVPGGRSVVGGVGLPPCESPRATEMASRSDRTTRVCPWSAMPASAALSGDRRQGKPSCRAVSADASPPRAARTEPSRANSPSATTSQAVGGIRPAAPRTARAMGRSYALPDLGRSAGARFTVTDLAGKRYSEIAMAARTRSRASRTAVSGNPTTVSRPRSPPPTWASTLTGRTSTPTKATEWVAANMAQPYGGGLTRRAAQIWSGPPQRTL